MIFFLVISGIFHVQLTLEQRGAAGLVSLTALRIIDFTQLFQGPTRSDVQPAHGGADKNAKEITALAEQKTKGDEKIVMQVGNLPESPSSAQGFAPLRGTRQLDVRPTIYVKRFCKGKRQPETHSPSSRRPHRRRGDSPCNPHPRALSEA